MCLAVVVMCDGGCAVAVIATSFPPGLASGSTNESFANGCLDPSPTIGCCAILNPVYTIGGNGIKPVDVNVAVGV